MIKVIIFDFDGVLVESVDIKTKAFAKLFEGEGRAAVDQVVDYHVRNTGVSRFEKIKYIYKNILKRKLTEEVFQELCATFARLVVDEVVRAPYVKGAKEFLDDASGHYGCFISSATPQREIEEIVKARKMGRSFKAIYGAPQKKSDIVEKIIRENSISGNEAVYVGDAMSDYTAASTHGVHFIARIGDVDTIFGGIDCIKVRDLTDLKNIVDKL